MPGLLSRWQVAASELSLLCSLSRHSAQGQRRERLHIAAAASCHHHRHGQRAAAEPVLSELQRRCRGQQAAGARGAGLRRQRQPVRGRHELREACLPLTQHHGSPGAQVGRLGREQVSGVSLLTPFLNHVCNTHYKCVTLHILQLLGV